MVDRGQDWFRPHYRNPLDPLDENARLVCDDERVEPFRLTRGTLTWKTEARKEISKKNRR